MSDFVNKPEPKGVSTCKLVDLLVDATQSPSHSINFEPHTELESHFQLGLSWLFGGDNFDLQDGSCFNDEKFSPTQDDNRWNNKYVALF